MAKNIEKIGQRIKEIRIKEKMSQAELAEGIFTRNQLSQIENGKSLPSVSGLLDICEKLNVSLHYLVAGEADEDIVNDSSILAKMDNSIREGNWSRCLELYFSLTRPSSLAGKMFVIALYESAIEDIKIGNYVSAKDSLQMCKFKLKEHGINDSKLQFNVNCILEYIDNRQINVSFQSGYDDQLIIYLSLIERIKNNKIIFEDIKKIDYLLPEMKNHLIIKCLIKDGQFKKAYEELKLLLSNDVTYPVKQEALKDFKKICDYQKNFDEAYDFYMRKSEKKQN